MGLQELAPGERSASVFPSPASQVSTEAIGEDRAPSEGDAMEVCSEQAEAHPEPPRERRVYSHRSVPGPFLNQVLNFCFWRILGLMLSVPTERSHTGLECWLQGEMKSLNPPLPLGDLEPWEHSLSGPQPRRGWKDVGCDCPGYNYRLSF